VAWTLEFFIVIVRDMTGERKRATFSSSKFHCQQRVVARMRDVSAILVVTVVAELVARSLALCALRVSDNSDAGWSRC